MPESERELKVNLLLTSVEVAERGEGDAELLALSDKMNVSKCIVGGCGRIGRSVSRGNGGNGASGGIGK